MHAALASTSLPTRSPPLPDPSLSLVLLTSESPCQVSQSAGTLDTLLVGPQSPPSAASCSNPPDCPRGGCEPARRAAPAAALFLTGTACGRGDRPLSDMAAQNNGPHQAQQQPAMDNPDMVRARLGSCIALQFIAACRASLVGTHTKAALIVPRGAGSGEDRICRQSSAGRLPLPSAKASKTLSGGVIDGSPVSQVGSQFVNQYYTVMKSSPKYLHRFYNDNSTFTFVDPGQTGSPAPYTFTARSQKARTLLRGSACRSLSITATPGPDSPPLDVSRLLLHSMLSRACPADHTRPGHGPGLRCLWGGPLHGGQPVLPEPGCHSPGDGGPHLHGMPQISWPYSRM